MRSTASCEWSGTSMWEIYALAQISELRTRAGLKQLSELELDILYARAKTRLWEKMARLRGVPELSVSDFGTRRRHSFLWHEYVVNAMRDTLGGGIVRDWFEAAEAEILLNLGRPQEALAKAREYQKKIAASLN